MYAGDEHFGEDVTNPLFRPVAPRELRLSPFCEGQLLHVHFMGDLKYQTDRGTQVPRARWAAMLDELTAGGYLEIKNGARLTAKGRAYVDAHHLSIEPLS